MVVVSCQLAGRVVKVFNDANDLKDSRTRPGGCGRASTRPYNGL